MALKQIMMGKKIQEKRCDLEKLLERKKELEVREKELEEAIDEAKTEEEIKEVEKAIEDFEAEKAENEEKTAGLEAEIAGLEAELKEVREKKPALVKREEQKNNNVERMEERSMRIKNGVFRRMTVQERDAFLKNEEVKEFLERVKNLKEQTRAVTGAELTIPEVVLEILRDNLHRYSKLIGLVRLKPVGGKARQTIAGTIPEGIWTEAVGKLNELEIAFNQVEVDGYKVGGYILIANSTIEDSDINMLDEILDALGQAIGIAVDKVVLYGTGNKMPTGIVTRLAQTVKPEKWGNYAPKWINLSTTHIKSLNILTKEGAKFFAELILGLGIAEENYSDGRKFWCMNSKTKTTIMSKSVTFNAAGAIVASQNNEMPVIGGEIVTLPFMKDNEVVGGYGSLYLLAERKGGQFAQSEHAKFIEDQMAFKGTARYDGLPVIGEGFVALNIGDGEVTKEMAFAPDTANTEAESESA